MILNFKNFVAAALVLCASGAAWACDLSLETRPTATADYFELTEPCLEKLPDGFAWETGLEYQFFEKVNEEREKAGLKKLQYRTPLREPARFHSLDMAANDYFAHDGPDQRSVSDRIRTFDRRSIIRGARENLAMTKGERSREKVLSRLHRGLMNSPGHRANILAENVTHMSIGVVKYEDGFWVTQLFINLTATLSEDLPVRMQVGDEIAPQVLMMSEWSFEGYEAELGDDEYLSLDGEIKPGLAGDIIMTIYSEQPGDTLDMIRYINFPGPSLTIGGTPLTQTGAGGSR